MNRRIHLCWILSIGLCSGLSAETSKPGQVYSDAQCGQDINMKDVLVLDLEPFRGQPERAQDFVDKYAGQYRLVYTEPQEFRMRSRASKDPYGVIKGARRIGVKSGCDLVLVLKTGPYLGRQRRMNSRIKDRGYALVVMGQRIP